MCVWKEGVMWWVGCLAGSMTVGTTYTSMFRVCRGVCVTLFFLPSHLLAMQVKKTMRLTRRLTKKWLNDHLGWGVVGRRRGRVMGKDGYGWGVVTAPMNQPGAPLRASIGGYRHRHTEMDVHNPTHTKFIKTHTNKRTLEKAT